MVKVLINDQSTRRRIEIGTVPLIVMVIAILLVVTGALLFFEWEVGPLAFLYGLFLVAAAGCATGPPDEGDPLPR